MKSVSVIVAFKNRDKVRVENFLHSFLIQDYLNKELIFINQGSDENISNYIESLFDNKPQVKYLYNYSQGHLWNKSNALNIGIKNSLSDYILILDVDLILPQNYISNLFLYLNEGHFITPNTFYLDKNFNINIGDLIQGKIPENAIENFIGICFVKREILNAMHGYDEFYTVWGAEDDDIIRRLQMFGLNRKIVSAYDLPSFHQWHKVLAPVEPNHWYIEMVQYLFKTKTSLRNAETWGKIIEKNERYFYNHEIVFSEENKILIEYSASLLIFNEFIEMFFNKTIKSGCVTIKIPLRNLKYRKYMLFIKQSIDNKSSFDICYNFLTYFISKYRNLILDYDFNYKAEELSFSYLKK